MSSQLKKQLYSQICTNDLIYHTIYLYYIVLVYWRTNIQFVKGFVA